MTNPVIPVTALTAVRNPLKPSQTLLFHPSDDSQVALDTKTDTPGGRPRCPPKSCPPVHDHVGALVYRPAAFASLFFENLTRVYGVTNYHPQGHPEIQEICQISPAVAHLNNAPQTKSNALAACGVQADGWLYYLSPDCPPKLMEYDLKEGQNAPSLLPDSDIFPLEGTTLAAYYNEDLNVRCCVYQTKKAGLMYYQVGNDGNGTISSVSNVFPTPGTPLAVAIVNGVVYLYFINENEAIGKVTRKQVNDPWVQVGGLGVPGEWLLNRPISSTVSEDGKHITIWQERETPTKDGEKFRSLMDRLNI